MKENNSAAETQRFIKSMTRYLELQPEESGEGYSVAPGDDLYAIAKELREIQGSLEEGFGMLEKKIDGMPEEAKNGTVLNSGISTFDLAA